MCWPQNGFYIKTSYIVLAEAPLFWPGAQGCAAVCAAVHRYAPQLAAASGPGAARALGHLSAATAMPGQLHACLFYF